MEGESCPSRLLMRTLFEKTNEERGLGYTSFAEFVKESIRKRVEEIRLAYDEG